MKRRLKRELITLDEIELESPFLFRVCLALPGDCPLEAHHLPAKKIGAFDTRKIALSGLPWGKP